MEYKFKTKKKLAEYILKEWDNKPIKIREKGGTVIPYYYCVEVL